MTERKWTPGPWVVEALTGSDPNGDEWETDIEITSSGGVFIHGHDLGYSDKTDAYIKATAHLISASPDLYEALSDAIEAWGTHNKSGDGMQGDWVQDARAALAKAEGRTP